MQGRHVKIASAGEKNAFNSRHYKISEGNSYYYQLMGLLAGQDALHSRMRTIINIKANYLDLERVCYIIH